MPAELFILSNPQGTATGAVVSEQVAWTVVQDLAKAVRQATDAATRNVVSKHLDALARQMLAQVQRGVHRNPPKGHCMSYHVHAVAYEHEADGERYCHGFGDAEITLQSKRAGHLEISGLHDQTDVAMYAMPDGSIRLASTRGRCLWDDFATEDTN